MIEPLPYLELVGEAADGAKAFELIISKLPDIAILDLEMPILNGLEVCKKILSEKHFTKFIILTMHKEKHYYTEAMKAGVHGYLLKDNAITDFVTCIEVVSNNQFFVSKYIEDNLVDNNSINLPNQVSQLKELLSPTEYIILKLISDGKTSTEIAKLLFCSPNTVENHRAKMNKKLSLDGKKNTLLKFAMENKGLL